MGDHRCQRGIGQGFGLPEIIGLRHQYRPSDPRRTSDAPSAG